MWLGENAFLLLGYFQAMYSYCIRIQSDFFSFLKKQQDFIYSMHHTAHYLSSLYHSLNISRDNLQIIG